MRTKIKTPGKKELTRLYKKTGSIHALAKHLGVSAWVICDRFQKLKIPLLERHIERDLKLPPKDKILALYSQLKNKQALARHLGCPYGVIRWYFEKNAIPTSSDLRKYEVNDNFFALDNELSFYWAGFIAADGCISGDTNQPTKLVLDIGARDHNHLVRFLKDLKSNYPIHTAYGPNPSNKKEFCKKSILGITSSKIVSDLKRFNIKPQKSGSFKLPAWLMKHNLLHHFIRGWVDGDGFFGVRKIIQQPFVGLTGNIASLKQFRSILVSKCGLSKVSINVQGKSSRYGYQYGACTWFGKFNVIKVRDFLYNNATIFLQRKLDAAQLADHFSFEEWI